MLGAIPAGHADAFGSIGGVHYIRIYDDNNEFNPRKEMKKIESEPARSGEEKIGLRLVKSITDRYGAFDYQNTAGINTSIVELRC